MRADELLLFIQYDSVEGTPRFVFHAAIDNEADISVRKPIRKSIEVRVLVIFEPDPLLL